ncbi:hypothetical protein ZIOFF_068418 [Zingiber officinale]|uniref:Uncharacterized protein n=1 Tax=Zingiber officinale TaxID=94328 RepID=A0A8J5EVM4_ZINOF|nr:hypothetical protein ZIOFF_068418 [Zingiber officinale]
MGMNADSSSPPGNGGLGLAVACARAVKLASLVWRREIILKDPSVLYRVAHILLWISFGGVCQPRSVIQVLVKSIEKQLGWVYGQVRQGIVVFESYQLEVLEKAKKENMIVFLEMGSRKTLITIM